ncbi:TonB-dependent receptor plug domain-containing protein [Psychrobacter faecalis]|uniref:TonB-dependent receptor plug domain-containing protein n=1 Tax=Psychrobacter faecalis TaxID=180588 RepID=UPI003FD06E87
MALSRSSSTTYLRLCILSALGGFAMSATAATGDSSVINHSELPQVELDKIVVTATRTPTKTSNVIAQTRVIDQEDLKRFQGQTIMEVLRRQPGFSIKQDGGVGTSSNFYMRGYSSNQILVLIDGIRYSSASLGNANLNLLAADQIDRIEILYGASGSSIYGADAMGGVIQIFTKGANIEKSNLSVTAGVGSHDHYTYGASAQLANEHGTALSLSASHNETNGFNALSPNPVNSNYNADDDGFESNNFSIALNKRINEQWLAGASALYSKSTTEFDAGTVLKDAYADQENGSAQAFVDWRYLPGSSVKLQYGHSIDKSDTYDNFPSTFDTKQDQVSLLGQHKLPVGQGIYGLEYLNQSLDSTSYEIDNRDVKSAFLGYVLASNQFDVQANLRFDDNSQYGNQTTYNLGGAYHINPNLRIGTSYAKGFRAPTFNEIYPGYGGDPDLKPETSDNYEIFAEYNDTLQSTRLTGYHNEVDDLIAYLNGTATNINAAKTKGISLTSDWVVNDYLFGGSYDYQQAKDSDDGKFLAFRPEHSGLIYTGYRLSNLDIRAEVEYVGKRYSSSYDELDNYTLLNISGNYHINPNLILSSRLNNITNKDYTTNENYGQYGARYNQDGTNFFTSLTYNWF